MWGRQSEIEGLRQITLVWKVALSLAIPTPSPGSPFVREQVTDPPRRIVRVSILCFLLVKPRGVSPFLLYPELQWRAGHLVGAQKIFVSTTKVPSLSSWMSCGHNGLNVYIVTSPLVTKSHVGAGLGNSKGNARNTGRVFQRWWLLSSHDILFSAFSALCSVSMQQRPEDAIGNTMWMKSMPSEMSTGGKASLWGWVFYLCLFFVLCRRREGRKELNKRKRIHGK